MKKYKKKEKQDKLKGIMHNRSQVSFRVLEQLEQDGIIEDYDLFRVISDHFNDMYMFYMNGQYNIIKRNRKDFEEIERSLLQDRYFVLNRCTTNNIQGYLQRYGREAFNKLSTAEFIEVMLRHKDSLLRTEEER